MAVYYTALLVNVGCHADAHEQAKACHVPRLALAKPARCQIHEHRLVA